MELGTGVKLLDEKTEVFVSWYGNLYPVTKMEYKLSSHPRLIIKFDEKVKVEDA